MKPCSQNRSALRTGFASAAVLGLGALTGCVSMAGNIGECMERGGTVFYVSTSFNEKCGGLKFAETLAKVPAPDVVAVSLRARAKDDPAFARILREQGEQELKALYNAAPPQPAQAVDCEVANVRMVEDRKEFDLVCPSAPVR